MEYISLKGRYCSVGRGSDSISVSHKFKPIKGSSCFFEQKLYPHCLVLVGFMKHKLIVKST